MASFIKNWKSYINESYITSRYPFRIYCDMDGVLVNLVQGIIDGAGFNIADDDVKQRTALFNIMNSSQMWESFKGKSPAHDEVLDKMFDLMQDNAEFWADLPPTSDAQALWDIISPYDPFVLSMPWKNKKTNKYDEDCKLGKRMWFMGRKISNPPPQSRILLVGDKGTPYKEAYAYNTAMKSPNILIDDMPRFLGPWEDAGGYAIHHTSAANTGKLLDEAIAYILSKKESV